MGRNKHLLLVALIWALGILLGLVYLNQIKSSPFFYDPVIDEESYDEKAMGIMLGRWPGDNVFYQDPLYPYFLSGIYSMFGRDLYIVRLANVVLASLNLLAIYLIGRLIYDSRTGILAMLAGAIYLPYYFYQGMLIKTTLGICVADFALVFMLLAGRRALGWSLAAGVFTGLAALSRGNFLAIIPVFLIWLFIVDRSDIKKSAAKAALCLAGFVAVILPVTVHNFANGERVLITSQGGQNFYIGNHRLNNAGTYIAPSFLRAHPEFEEADFRREAKRRLGLDLSASSLSQFWYRQAFEELLADKKRAALHFLKKARLALNGFEVSDNLNYYFYRGRYSKLLAKPLLTFGVAGAFGIAGILLILWRSRSSRKYGEGLLISYLAVYWLTMAAYFVFARYRIVMVGPLLVFGSYAVIKLHGYFRYGPGRSAVALTVVIIGTGAFVNLPMMELSFDVSHYLLGNHKYKAGDLEGAAKSYSYGLRLNPNNVLIRSNLARTFAEAGLLEEAREEFERARKIAPLYPGIRAGLAEVYFKQGKYKEAATQYGIAISLSPDDVILWLAYGVTMEKLGDFARANMAYSRALTIEPGNNMAKQGLARVLLGL